DQVEDPRDPKKGHRGPDSGKLEEAGIARAPIQIHRWIAKDVDGNQSAEHVIADWVIAERLLVRRGEQLGRRNVIVEVPTWNKFKNEFEILNTTPPKKVGGKPAPHGIMLDFTVSKPAPLLVDFDGGPRLYQHRTSNIREDSAMDLLILGPNGKL